MSLPKRADFLKVLALAMMCLLLTGACAWAGPFDDETITVADVAGASAAGAGHKALGSSSSRSAQSGATVCGTLKDPDGTVLRKSLRVYLWNKERAFEITTDSGSFQVQGIPAGEYWMDLFVVGGRGGASARIAKFYTKFERGTQELDFVLPKDNAADQRGRVEKATAGGENPTAASHSREKNKSAVADEPTQKTGSTGFLKKGDELGRSIGANPYEW
ncbi:MAG: hypothetical protein GX442_24110 [Candidatus Riflebacteria bacterium]|nr:hypothetical protein [Candidatus Riflebacteria bacterium]